MLTLVLVVLIMALAFEFINGFHDTANAIATSIGTKVLTPSQAILLASVFNLVGALAGAAVAKTIGQGLVDTSLITLGTILCALIGAIIWNLITWYVGLPSSSSHAIVGGLCGAALASANMNWAVIKWSSGLWPKVVRPMFLAPIIGIVGGYLVMLFLMVVLRRMRPHLVNFLFGKAQLLSAAWMSFSHGTNDAQKTMGIIALTLFTASSKTDAFAGLPTWLHFLHTPNFEIATWIKVVCAITMAAGTAMGGWRIIKTVGKTWSASSRSMVFPPKPRLLPSLKSPLTGASLFPPLMSSPAPSWASAPPSGLTPSSGRLWNAWSGRGL